MDLSVVRPVIVAGCRTPFARAGAELRTLDGLELGLHVLDGLLPTLPVGPGEIGALRWGSVVLDPRIPHPARELVLRSGLPDGVRAVTVTDNCITGATVVIDLVQDLVQGRARWAVAGGAESMSNPAIQLSPAATRRLVGLASARGAWPRLKALAALRPWHFVPRAPSVAEPSTGLSMGEHCELMVKTWGITREAQDALALASHRHAAEAAAAGWFGEELHSLPDVPSDTLVRSDASASRLAALRPVFDSTPGGTITAGNSSPLTDGAAALVLTTQAAAERAGREPLARISGYEFSAIDPADGLLMAPAVAVPRLLARLGLGLEDLDLVEVHEAFAGQVLCNLAAWARGWKEPAIGCLDPGRINLRGGSLAIGHPFAATGIRMVLSLARQMHATGARRGLISICGAGATAAALLLEAA